MRSIRCPGTKKQQNLSVRKHSRPKVINTFLKISSIFSQHPSRALRSNQESVRAAMSSKRDRVSFKSTLKAGKQQRSTLNQSMHVLLPHLEQL